MNHEHSPTQNIKLPGLFSKTILQLPRVQKFLEGEMLFSSVETKNMSISFFYLLKSDKCFDGGLKWTNTNFAAESGTGCRNLGAEIVQFFRALPPETALVPISLVGFSDICNCACSRVQKYLLHKTKQTNKSLPKRKVHE